MIKVCILMGSPRLKGNTAELLKPFIAHLGENGCTVEYITLHDKEIKPCGGCFACQHVSGKYGCVLKDDVDGIMDAIIADLGKITGQKAVICKAKKSVANFKLREGMPVGAKVTLRGERMYEFVDRLFNASLPRVRDFRGINPGGFDGRGNYAFGLRDQLIFPEIDYDKIDKTRGMDIAFITTAKTDEESKELLTLLGAPFAK